MADAIALTAACAAEALLLDLESEFPETMPDTKRNAVPKPAKATPAKVAGHNGDVLNQAISLRWKSKKRKINELATKAGMDYTTLRGYIRNGFEETPDILVPVCILLGIDREALSRGRIEDMKPHQMEQEAISVLKEPFRSGKGDEALDYLNFVRDRVARNR